MNQYELHTQRLREIGEELAPGLSIAVGDKVYLFISSSSTKQAEGFSPRISEFSQRGKVLISLEVKDDGITHMPPKESVELLVTLKVPLLGKDVILEEKVLFHEVNWTTEAEKIQVLDNIYKEILNWSNRITMGFIA